MRDHLHALLAACVLEVVFGRGALSAVQEEHGEVPHWSQTGASQDGAVRMRFQVRANGYVEDGGIGTVGEHL